MATKDYSRGKQHFTAQGQIENKEQNITMYGYHMYKLAKMF